MFLYNYLKGRGDNKKISSDFAENLCLGVFRGQELESGVRFPKFSSESGEIGQWQFPGFSRISGDFPDLW